MTDSPTTIVSLIRHIIFIGCRSRARRRRARAVSS
jgi:hypothetical protein